jgi:hypothetical protein
VVDITNFTASDVSGRHLLEDDVVLDGLKRKSRFGAWSVSVNDHWCESHRQHEGHEFGGVHRKCNLGSIHDAVLIP